MKQKGLARLSFLNKNSRGFTLIELLVVIAIIGILASVVLTQVNSARDKTLDVAVKSDLDGIRAGSVVLYDTYGNRYNDDGTTAATTVDCGVTAGQVVHTIFGDTNIALALSHIKKSNGAVALTCNVPANGSGYSIVATLKTGGFVCLDGTGALKTTTGVAGTTVYDSVTGGTSPALASATAIICN